MELLNGFLYLLLDLGDGPTKIRASNKVVNNGAWHQVFLVRNGRSGNIKVDEDGIDFETPGRDDRLELTGPLYIGGIDMVKGTAPMRTPRKLSNGIHGTWPSKHIEQRWIPPVLWTATLRQGFVGCFRDLSINGRSIDVAEYANRQDSGALSLFITHTLYYDLLCNPIDHNCFLDV